MLVLIGGGSGFIGSALTARLHARGDRVTWISRTPGPERITWQKTPIVVALTVGKERRVDFPGSVKVGLPAAIQSAIRDRKSVV